MNNLRKSIREWTTSWRKPRTSRISFLIRQKKTKTKNSVFIYKRIWLRTFHSWCKVHRISRIQIDRWIWIWIILSVRLCFLRWIRLPRETDRWHRHRLSNRNRNTLIRPTSSFNRLIMWTWIGRSSLIKPRIVLTLWKSERVWTIVLLIW